MPKSHHQVKTAFGKMPTGILLTTSILLFGLIGLTGCGAPEIVPLMPTPILFDELGVSPLDHIPVDEQWNLRRVYYATNRKRSPNLQKIHYTNDESDTVSVGLALIGFGGQKMTWADLSKASSRVKRDETVELTISGLLEVGSYDLSPQKDVRHITGATSWLMADINRSIETARDKDILVYVHGAKVNFYNACAFAAQLDHFMGRDMTSIAFAWPTRQNILAYGLGEDVDRAYRASKALASLLELLSENSRARRIHLLAWSAGGRVLTTALHELWSHHSGESAEEIRNHYRLGTVYFAASDVPGEEFIKTLPALNAISQRVVVTASSKDQALSMSKLFMGGGTRIGLITRDLSPSERQIVFSADRLEVVDLSRGSDVRGFDITGHRYWFNQPWASSDMILAIRSDLGPAERGLEKTDIDILWYIPKDYPKRLRASMLRPGLKIRETE